MHDIFFLYEFNKMKKILINLNWSLWLSITLVMMSSSVYAADCPTDIKAVTNKDAKVPVAVLTYRVKPLTKCELEVEAQAWLLLLKEKVAEISDAEVAAIYKKEEINKAEEVESTQQDAKEAKEGDDRKEAIDAAEEAKAALKEEKEVEKKSTQDASVQKAIKEATKKPRKRASPFLIKTRPKKQKPI